MTVCHILEMACDFKGNTFAFSWTVGVQLNGYLFLNKCLSRVVYIHTFAFSRPLSDDDELSQKVDALSLFLFCSFVLSEKLCSPSLEPLLHSSYRSYDITENDCDNCARTLRICKV